MIRTLSLTLSALFYGLGSNAQQDYTIVFAHTYGTVINDSVKTFVSLRNEVLYTNSDTLSFFEFSDSRKSNKRLVGIRGINHGIYIYPKPGHIFYEYSNNEIFLEKDSMVNRNWVLENDSMTICGFICLKASSGAITAWYTPEITIPVGPAYYYGLPGLILQVNDPGRNWLITATQVIPGSPVIRFPQQLKGIRPARL